MFRKKRRPYYSLLLIILDHFLIKLGLIQIKKFFILGTDGYGRSDTRKNLRKFFEVDKEHIVAYTLSALAKEQLVATQEAEKAFKKYKIDKEKDFPPGL